MAFRSITDKNASFRQGEYRLVNNIWNSGDLEIGADYTQSIAFNTNHVTRDVTFRWDFGSHVSDTIFSYPSIAAGYDPWSGVGSKKLVTKISSLRNLDIDFDVSIGGNVDKFNVAFDIWLTGKAAGGARSITTEVMVWLHGGKLSPAGKVVDSYSDGDYSATVRTAGGFGDSSGGSDVKWRYIALDARKDMLDGTIDMDGIFRFLVNAGLVSGDDFIYGFEFGSEVSGGHGRLKVGHIGYQFSRYDVTMKADRLVGTGQDDVIGGRGGADLIVGGRGDDVLSGDGGQDRLVGGRGYDSFVFKSPQTGSHDRVLDFNPRMDEIQLDIAGFAPGSPSSLDPGKFADPDHVTNATRIIYDGETGRLFHDADGAAGSHHAMLIATLQGKPFLAATDILLF